MREHSERLRQLLPGELFGCATYFDGLGHGDRKIFCLINQASRSHFVRFGRIHEIQPKEVSFRTDAHMKTVAVIRRVRDQSAIFQNNPLLRFASPRNVDSCGPKNSNANERAYTDS